MKKVHNRFRSYNINVPLELADEIMSIAKENGVFEIDVIRQFLKLGLLAVTKPLYTEENLIFKEVQVFDPKPEVAPVSA